MSPSEYQELVDFLTGQFGQVDRRITALHRFVEDRFLELDRRFDRVDERFQEVLGHLDEIYRRLERLEQEYYAISQQLRRIEGPDQRERPGRFSSAIWPRSRSTLPGSRTGSPISSGGWAKGAKS